MPCDIHRVRRSEVIEIRHIIGVAGHFEWGRTDKVVVLSGSDGLGDIWTEVLLIVGGYMLCLLLYYWDLVNVYLWLSTICSLRTLME